VVRSVREGIRLPHAATRSVVECEVKMGQVERPACLSMVKLLRRAEILQVLVVHPDLDSVACPFQVVPPLFQSTDDHQHFGVVDFVVAFHCTEAFGQEGHRVPLTIFVTSSSIY
jgi:hypothetical protein